MIIFLTIWFLLGLFFGLIAMAIDFYFHREITVQDLAAQVLFILCGPITFLIIVAYFLTEHQFKDTVIYKRKDKQ